VDLSIIIVSWNVRDLLLKCLQSIFESQTCVDFEILVVDNASKDGSAEQVKTLYPQVRCIENTGNPGFARANNQAIQICNGRHILLLNPDTKVFPGALDNLVKFLDEHPDAGAAGSRLLNPDGSLQASCFPFPTLVREFWRLFHLDRLKPLALYRQENWDTIAPRSVEVVQGTSLILRRAALDQVGLLDEAYFVYTEETDMCYRLHKAGWERWWVPQSRVTHYGGQSTQQVALDMFVSLYRTKTIFIRKHYGATSAWLYRSILLLAALTRLVLYGFTIFGTPARRQEYRLIAANYLHLIRALPSL
jgi:N-acetylglucosaminyl-diphospho-decaprenol L-rhamnosyltransferase